MITDWEDLHAQIIPVSPSAQVMPSLPGRSLPGEGCGSEIPHVCNSCNHSFIVKSSCMLRTCPNCWRKWAWKVAKKSALRIWSGSQLITGRRRGFRLVHCVVSMPASSPLKQQRIVARETLKRHGISGGLLIWHPFRQDDDVFVPDGYDHFHCIGLARGDIKPGNDPEILFKVIRDAKRGDFKGFRRCKEIKACIFYLLTHCGIVKGRHTLTYFGELSYNQLSTEKWLNAFPDIKDELERRDARVCPNCHSEDIEPAYYLDYTSGQPMYVPNCIDAG